MVLGLLIRIRDFLLNAILEHEIFRGKQSSEIDLSFDLKQTILDCSSFLHELVENGLLISLDIFVGPNRIATKWLIFTRFDCSLHHFSSNLRFLKIGHEIFF